jgi:hypothetical protein
MERFIAVLAACGASVCGAEPVQVFGGELAIGDNASGFVIDVNSDGRFDVEFAYFGISVNSIFGWDGFIRQEDPGSEVRFGGGLDGNDRAVHDRFAEGAEIGPAIDGGFPFGAIAYESFFDGLSGGDWLDMQPGFVGFSFLATDGGRHYAWAEVAIDNEDNYEDGFLILTRIAYETEAGVPIAAGDDGSDPGCNAADLAEPFGLLDLADVLAFATAFTGMEDAADLDGNGLWDLADVTAFIGAFTGGCP